MPYAKNETRVSEALIVRPLVALIDEERCIGCTLCLQACPVDAIVGAAKFMHTVISGACTGCELCVPPCPVDCISIEPIAEREPAARCTAEAEAQRRSEARRTRLEREHREREAQIAARREAGAQRRKRETVARAVERARLRLGRP